MNDYLRLLGTISILYASGCTNPPPVSSQPEISFENMIILSPLARISNEYVVSQGIFKKTWRYDKNAQNKLGTGIQKYFQDNRSTKCYYMSLELDQFGLLITGPSENLEVKKSQMGIGAPTFGFIFFRDTDIDTLMINSLEPLQIIVKDTSLIKKYRNTLIVLPIFDYLQMSTGISMRIKGRCNAYFINSNNAEIMIEVIPDFEVGSGVSMMVAWSKFGDATANHLYNAIISRY